MPTKRISKSTNATARQPRVAVLGNASKPRVRETVRRFLRLIRRYATVAVVDLEERSDIAGAHADMVVVFGGDGAILSAARRLGRNQAPIIGVNLGKLGFLAAFTPDELRDSLADILGGKHDVAQRMMLRCQVIRAGESISESIAVNDAVMSRGSLSRLIFLDFKISGALVTTYAGDGLVISTPIGSTAHSLSAGGPILTPQLEAIIVTPICPHTLSNRPLVVSSSEAIEVVVKGRSRDVALTVDGQVYVPLQENDVIRVETSPVKLQLIETRQRTFFQTLHTKLGWGGHPNYAKG